MCEGSLGQVIMSWRVFCNIWKKTLGQVILSWKIYEGKAERSEWVAWTKIECLVWICKVSEGKAEQSECCAWTQIEWGMMETEIKHCIKYGDLNVFFCFE